MLLGPCDAAKKFFTKPSCIEEGIDSSEGWYCEGEAPISGPA